jgi:hypothetical protein
MNEQLLVQIILGILTLLIYPFIAYSFKKNEALHEKTQEKLSAQGTMLAVHEVKIMNLERSLIQPPSQNVTVNPPGHE